MAFPRGFPQIRMPSRRVKIYVISYERLTEWFTKGAIFKTCDLCPAIGNLDDVPADAVVEMVGPHDMGGGHLGLGFMVKHDSFPDIDDRLGIPVVEITLRTQAPQAASWRDEPSFLGSTGS
jgi:hypothetical protein